MSLDLVNLLLVLLAALVGGLAAQRLGYPAILGELAAGIVLGPPMLGLLSPDDALTVIGKLGVVLLMLYIGLHLDASTLGRVARPASLAAAGGFVVPAALGFGLMMLVDGDPVAASFVAIAMGVTSLATKSRILVDLGILNTRVAHVLLAGALLADVAALVLFSAILGLAATGTIAVGGLVATAIKAVVFLLGTWVVGTRAFPLIGRALASRPIDPAFLFLGVVSVALAFGAVADAAGLHAILGSFLAGLFIREGVLNHDQLADVESRAKGVSVGLLTPVFFVTAGFDVSFDVFRDAPLLLAGIVILATVGKVLGTALFYIPTGFGFREGVTVGAGMNGRGAVEIIVAELALAAGIINAEVFSILVFMAIFTTATVPILLTKAIAWLRKHGELVTDERDGYVIVGAGPVARKIASLLVAEAPVALIDTNAEHCRAAEAQGLRVVKGNSLDEDVLADAGARHAKALIATTGNLEVNLLAGRVAARRFGIESIHVCLPTDTSDSIHSMLGEFDGSLMFGRPVDIGEWDVDLDHDRTSDGVRPFAMAASGDAYGVSEGQTDLDLDELPLLIRTSAGHEVFDPVRKLNDGDVILTLHRDRQDHPPIQVAPTNS